MKNLITYNTGKKVLAAATGVALMFTSIGAAKANQELKVKNADGTETVITLPDNAVEARIDNGVTIIILDSNKDEINVVTDSKSEKTEQVDEATSVELEKQNTTMTVEDYRNMVASTYNKLKNTPNFDMYDEIMEDIQCYVYLKNIVDIRTSGIEDDLIAKGWIYKNNLTMVGHPGQFDYVEADPSGWYNVNSADRFINHFNDYCHQAIATTVCIPENEVESDLYANPENVEVSMSNEWIDNIPSLEESCFRQKDKDIEIEAVNKIKAYGKALVRGNEEEIIVALNDCHSLLTSLNASSTDASNVNASLGSQWSNLRILGVTEMLFTERKLYINYSAKTLSEFYCIADLNELTFIPRMDKEIEYKLIKDSFLRELVQKDQNMFKFALENSSNELFNLLGYNCVTPEELNTKSR